MIPATAADPPRFVREQFLRLLGRPPGADELSRYVEALRDDPAVTPRLVLWALVSSPEYLTD
ncbi:MAG: hypothetical protein ACE5JG_11070 [Planctomycetota bacterium]